MKTRRLGTGRCSLTLVLLPEDGMHRLFRSRLLLAIRIRRLLWMGLAVFCAAVPGLAAAEPEDLYLLRDGGNCQYFDRQGAKAFAVRCQDARDFRQGRAPVQFSDGLWGFVDKHGQTIVRPEYQDADSFSEGLARVRKGGLNGYIDLDGRLVLPFKYARSGRLRQGLIWYQCSTGIFNSAYMDRSGKQVLPCKYQEASDFGPDGLARARMWDLYGFIDARGTAVLNFAYRLAGHFDGGMTGVLRDDGFFYIDRSGRRLLRVAASDTPGDFSEGLAPVRSGANMRWGYMDSAGRLAIASVFFEAGPFHRGLALVRGPDGYRDASSTGKDSSDEGDLRWFYVDRSGRRLFP